MVIFSRSGQNDNQVEEEKTAHMSPQQTSSRSHDFPVCTEEVRALEEEVLAVEKALKENYRQERQAKKNIADERRRRQVQEQAAVDKLVEKDGALFREKLDAASQQHAQRMRERRQAHAQNLANSEAILARDGLIRRAQREERIFWGRGGC